MSPELYSWRREGELRIVPEPFPDCKGRLHPWARGPVPRLQSQQHSGVKSLALILPPPSCEYHCDDAGATW